MRTLAFLLLLAAPMLAHATDIHPGDSLADVQAALDAPKGRAQLVDGRVTSINFISPEDFAAQQARQKADESKASQLRAQHMAEGKALKAKMLADPGFIYALPADQIAFWQDFRLRYPEVSCDKEYNLAQQQFAAQRQFALHQQQFAEQQQFAAEQRKEADMQRQIDAAKQEQIEEQVQEARRGSR